MLKPIFRSNHFSSSSRFIPFTKPLPYRSPPSFSVIPIRQYASRSQPASTSSNKPNPPQNTEPPVSETHIIPGRYLRYFESTRDRTIRNKVARETDALIYSRPQWKAAPRPSNPSSSWRDQTPAQEHLASRVRRAIGKVCSEEELGRFIGVDVVRIVTIWTLPRLNCVRVSYRTISHDEITSEQIRKNIELHDSRLSHVISDHTGLKRSIKIEFMCIDEIEGIFETLEKEVERDN